MSSVPPPPFTTATEEKQLRAIAAEFAAAGLHGWKLVHALLHEVHLLRLTVRQLTLGVPRAELAELPDGILPRLLLLPAAPADLALTRWPTDPLLDHARATGTAPVATVHEHLCPACHAPWQCTIDRSVCATETVHCDACWPNERRRRARVLFQRQAG